MAAYVRVNELVSAAIGVGISEYANMLITPINRRGRTSRGSRIIRASNVDKLMVPKRVVVACVKAADTISLDVGVGTTLRWKYHCDTVAAVVDLWIPLMTDNVQMYISTK